MNDRFHDLTAGVRGKAIQDYKDRLRDVRELSEQLDRAKNALELQAAQTVHIIYGLKIFSVVFDTRKGDEVQVIHIDYSTFDPDRGMRPHVSGLPRVKDGSWARRMRKLYDEWEMVR